ncbi:glycosyltransferase [Ammoniphilus sp. 3BR4]|uniref:glycosyltransferase n=1 Tax=Ammoniphilus sp. 3BR4 TaxID=3158265 RepID=UPI0034652763
MKLVGVYLDGSTMIDISHKIPKIKNNFTYEFWVKPVGKLKIYEESTNGTTGTKSQKYIIGPQYGVKPICAGIGVSVGRNGICVFEHTENYLPATLAYRTKIKDWCHIAVVYYNRIPYLYINGEFKKRGLKSSKETIYASGLFGGHDRYGFFEGNINELRLWDHARTPEQIKYFTNSSMKENEKSLVVHWNSKHFLLNIEGSQAYSIKYPAPPKKDNLLIESKKRIEGKRHKLELNPIDSVSIVIPTFNAMSDYDFVTLLRMLQYQKGFKKKEIIVVDSGSTDGTSEIAEKYGAKVIGISQKEFSHSYARNLGAEHATHPYILFITQDILPPSEHWLSEIYTYLKNNNLAAVSCAETPREDADLYYRISSWLHHCKFLKLKNSDKILCKPKEGNYLELRKSSSITDITCLLDKQIFMKYKYRHSFAEDLDLGVRLIGKGYKLGLMVSTKVIHSHNRSPYYYLKRSFADTISLSEIFKDLPISNITFKPLVKDILYTYNALYSIFPENVQTRKKIRLENFEGYVRNSFENYKCINYPISISLSPCKYIDSALYSLLEELHPLYSISQDQKYDGCLIRSLLKWLKVSSDYMHRMNDVLDEKLLEDYIQSIFKAFASRIGSMLAQCYKRNNIEGNVKQLIKSLKEGV